MNDKRKQVADQCRAVAHLCKGMREVFSDFAKMFDSDADMGLLVDMKGQETAALMEYLGDCMNEMDAVAEADEWMGPIFKRAHQMFPAQLSTPPAAEVAEIVKQLREDVASQDCELCAGDSGTYIRCGRGDCAKEFNVRINAAAMLTKLSAQVAQLERGEFICKQCGHRKDGEFDHHNANF